MRKTSFSAPALPPPPLRAALLTGLVALGACAQTDRVAGGGTPDQMRALTVSGVAAQAEPGLAAMRRAALAAPGDYALQARYAGALARSGELGMAEDIVVAALVRAPDHPALTQQLARIRVRGGQPQIALALFDRAALLQPGAEAEEGRGIALDMLGRHDEAQAAYRAALAQAPNRVSAQNNLAMSLMLTGRAAEAVAVLEPLSRRGDAPARVANNLAVARSMSGDASRVDVAAADPRDVRDVASNLRATVGAAPAQPAPSSQFAAVEPGRGGAAPLFPLDAEARSGFAAGAAPVALPFLQPPPAPALDTEQLMPAALPPRGPSALPTLEAQPPAARSYEPAVALAAPSRMPVPAYVEPAIPVTFGTPMLVTALLLPSPGASVATRSPSAQPAVVAVPAAPPSGRPASAGLPTAEREAASAPRRTTEALPQLASLSVPAPRAEATEDAPRGAGHVVQVGALSSEHAALAHWSSLRMMLPAEFDARTPDIARAELPQGTFWRLRTSGFASVTDARGFCEVLRGHGRDCWVPAGN